jgi:hypothetical protein
MITRHFSKTFTGVDADILADSELEIAPGTGIYMIRAASTVNTATLAVTGERAGRISPARAIVLRANAEILSADSAWLLRVTRSERVTIALAGTTGTVFVRCLYFGR